MPRKRPEIWIRTKGDEFILKCEAKQGENKLHAAAGMLEEMSSTLHKGKRTRKLSKLLSEASYEAYEASMQMQDSKGDK